MTDWQEVADETLKQRILDDSGYAMRRLGRIPTEEEVEAAVGKVDAVDALARALDPFEEDVWSALGADVRS